MILCDYVMTGRVKSFSGNTIPEIHKKFLNGYKEAEHDVRKVEIFKVNVDVKEFAMVLEYQLYKNNLVSANFSVDEMHSMIMKKNKTLN